MGETPNTCPKVGKSFTFFKYPSFKLTSLCYTKSWDTDAKEARFPQFLLPAKLSGSVWLTLGFLETKNELKAQPPVAHQNARVHWCCSVLLIALVNLN